jgi:hypothetical protein
VLPCHSLISLHASLTYTCTSLLVACIQLCSSTHTHTHTQSLLLSSVRLAVVPSSCRWRGNVCMPLRERALVHYSITRRVLHTSCMRKVLLVFRQPSRTIDFLPACWLADGSTFYRVPCLCRIVSSRSSFNAALDEAGRAVKLPFAARRMFTASGEEVRDCDCPSSRATSCAACLFSLSAESRLSFVPFPCMPLSRCRCFSAPRRVEFAGQVDKYAPSPFSEVYQ